MERDTSKAMYRPFPAPNINTTENNTVTKIQVLVQDYHDLYREGFATLLRIHGITVTSEVQTGIEAMQAITLATPPDIAIINYKTTKRESLNAACLIKQYHPDIKVIINSQFSYGLPIDKIKEIGIEGIIIKAIHSTAQMISAIHLVHNGGRFFSFTPSPL